MCLVIKDDDRTRGMLCARIGEFGHDVPAAENGRVAMRLARSQSVDLALVDQLMPDLIGVETYEMPRFLKSQIFR